MFFCIQLVKKCKKFATLAHKCSFLISSSLAKTNRHHLSTFFAAKVEKMKAVLMKIDRRCCCCYCCCSVVVVFVVVLLLLLLLLFCERQIFLNFEKGQMKSQTGNLTFNKKPNI
jgi:hypothetical protein